MDQLLYNQHYNLEKDHWWFVSRRKIIENIIQKYMKEMSPDARILDAGCGTGGNLLLLSKYSKNVIGLEYNIEAAKKAEIKTGIKVYQGSLPDNIPFSDSSFDLIVLLDVLEHIDDDIKALNTLNAKLKPNGSLLITVPAFKFLWSKHDNINNHKRRYTQQNLKNKIKLSGFTLKYCNYFNTILFPLILFIRMVKNTIPVFKNDSDFTIHSKIINKLLTEVMSFERFLINNFKLPFGVSIIALCEKS